MTSSSIIALWCLALLVFAVTVWVVFWPRYRMERIYRRPFPNAWLTILHRRLPFYERFPEKHQLQLRRQISLFLNDKLFIGCAGQEINDEIRITIAAQACLLTLNHSGYPYPGLKSVLVYPSTFVATRQVRDELGLVSTVHSTLLGESWSQGKVILAWDDVEKGVLNLQDGHNVVLHEFAHQLDQESGSTNGAPLLRSRSAYKSWAMVLLKEYEKLKREATFRQSSLLDHYGATNPAEFFAVATETFFEQPEQMLHHHSELYQELVGFYQIDPASFDSTAPKA